MRFAAIYGNGAVLGFTPQEVDKMSMWQFMAAIDGYEKAHATEQGLSATEKDELADWLGI